MEPTHTYPRLHIDTAPSKALGHYLKIALTPQIKLFAVHGPVMVLLDLAIRLALGGDALSDSTAVRDEPDLYGPVALKATITRIIQPLATDVDRG